jgi:hypothetical protein
MNDKALYEERITSNKTEALFILLTLLPTLIYIWSIKAGRKGKLTTFSLFLSILFFFYSWNYRTLVIRLTSRYLRLTFGLSSWNASLSNVKDCRLDEIPTLMRMGGAGIHFMMIRNRYRASFNFLEYPRVVIGLKNKVGPIQDISFSTRQPDRVIHLIQETIATHAGT